jgi:adenine phosphoribosyltransferase
VSEPTEPGLLAAPERELLRSRVRDIPDWPKPGVVFKDITPMLGDHQALAVAINALADAGRDADGQTTVDVVAGIEARGFILAAPVAQVLGVGFVPVRKAGKLPYDTMSASYLLEYGEETVEVHTDAFTAGDRVLLVDDVLATGGTVEATAGLIESAGARVAAVVVLIELGFLGARARLGSLDVKALLTL